MIKCYMPTGSCEMQEHPMGAYVKYEDHLKEVDRIMSEDNPSADALDWIWRDIILKYRPNYGEWEYPAQAYRHIVAEYEELRTMYVQLKKELDDINIRRMNPNCTGEGETSVSFIRSASKIVGCQPPQPKPAPSNVYITEGSQRVIPTPPPPPPPPEAGFTTKGG